MAIAWISLRGLLDQRSTGTPPPGSAAVHSHGARTEAARKLIMSHSSVRHDVTGTIAPSEPDSLRAACRDLGAVDQFLREVARRLLGCHEGSHELEERLDLSNPQQAMAWLQAAKHLEERIQGTEALERGSSGKSKFWSRARDLLWRRLTPPAAEALKGVMAEVRPMRCCVPTTLRAADCMSPVSCPRTLHCHRCRPPAHPMSPRPLAITGERQHGEMALAAFGCRPRRLGRLRLACSRLAYQRRARGGRA